MIRQCRIIRSWSEDRFVGTSPTTVCNLHQDLHHLHRNLRHQGNMQQSIHHLCMHLSHLCIFFLCNLHSTFTIFIICTSFFAIVVICTSTFGISDMCTSPVCTFLISVAGTFYVLLPSLLPGLVSSPSAPIPSKGLSHEIFTVIFWLEWIYLGLNGNSHWFLNFKEGSLILDSYFK